MSFVVALKKLISFLFQMSLPGEVPIDNFDRDHLVEGIRLRKYCQVLPQDEQELPSQVAAVAEPGDLVICQEPAILPPGQTHCRKT